MFSVHVPLFLVALHTVLNAVGATPLADYDAMPFNPYTDMVEYEMPITCIQEGKNYCFDKGDAYPEDKIEELVKDMHLLGQNIIDTPQTPTFIDHRQGPGRAPEEPDCETNSTSNFVYYIVDEHNKVRVVVQSQRFNQTYDMKWCLNEGRITNPTRHFFQPTLNNFVIECVNTWMDVDFFVLNDEDSAQLKLEIVRVKGGIPVCCRCRINSE